MRVDDAAMSPRTELDPRAQLRRFFGAVRRRWYLVLIPAVLGALLGWFSVSPPPTVENSTGATVTIPRATYYRATHVLIRESSGSDQSGTQSPVSLSQAAYLVNTGQVPVRVAEQLGLDVDEVEASLLGLPREQVSSIEVQAVGEDGQQVVAMADAAAAELLVVLKTQADADAATARDKVVARLDDLDRQISDLNAQIATLPPNLTQLEAQQRSLSNQYSLVFEQFSALANSPEPGAGLVSLEGAKAEEISESTYDATRKTIRDGADYVTGSPTTVPEGSTEVVEPTEEEASRPTRAVLGGLVGLALGIGIVLLLDRFDARLRRREDVEAATGLTVVAEIPPMVRKSQRSMSILAMEKPRSRSAEAYRVVRGAVMYDLGNRERPADGRRAAVIMVTSANPGEGKTTTVANLAAIMAEGGLDVLVVNCDFRRPRIHDYLLDEGAPDDDPAGLGVLRPRPTCISGVRLVTGIGEGDGQANPIEVVAQQRRAIDIALDEVDVILLDTAPFLATNDASELLPLTDQVLLVVRSGKTTAEVAHRTAQVMQRFAAPVLGVVFNGSEESHGAQYYYYGYTDALGSKETTHGPSTPRETAANPQ